MIYAVPTHAKNRDVGRGATGRRHAKADVDGTPTRRKSQWHPPQRPASTFPVVRESGAVLANLEESVRNRSHDDTSFGRMQAEQKALPLHHKITQAHL